MGLSFLFLAAAGAAFGAGGFVKLPAQASQSSPLQIRFVRYTGGANGKMVVQVRNPSQQSATFDPKGLFFVPNGNAEQAPQRLGAAGPFDVQGQRKSRLKLKPRQTVQLELQVFCLDSHRSSPGASQGFHVARKRLPRQLQHKIQSGTADILSKSKSPRRAKSAIQSHIWSSRNADWVKLEGERAAEKAAPRNNMPHQRRRPRLKRQIQVR